MWHDSQELEQTTCTAEELGIWMDLGAGDDAALAGALVDAGFLRIIGENHYEIIGNGKHIEALRLRKDAASLGGIRSGETRRKQIEATASNQNEVALRSEHEVTLRSKPQVPVEPCSVLFSSVQCSTDKEYIYKADAEQKKVEPEILETAVAQFERTLKHFKAGDKASQPEKEELWRLLKAGIPIDELAHAISGMRYEQGTDTYDPAKNIKLGRLWDRDKRMKLYRLSKQEELRREEKRKARGTPRSNDALLIETSRESGPISGLVDGVIKAAAGAGGA